jgi:DNA-binding transcriptional ArsR family regulator
VRAELDPTIAALADPSRRAIIELLGKRPRCSSDLADALDMSRPAMSRHLRVLRKAGVVEQEILDSDARVRMVQLRTEPLAALRGWLEEVEGFWEEQLGAFKSHAEGKRRKGRR